MSDKADELRFTLQFSRTDPRHIHAAAILNRQGRRSKAPYIVNAVLHYENCSETPNMNMPRTTELDIKVIEAVVNRMLTEREKGGPAEPPKVAHTLEEPAPQPEEISFDDALEVLGEDGITAIADAMELFRKK